MASVNRMEAVLFCNSLPRDRVPAALCLRRRRLPGEEQPWRSARGSGPPRPVCSDPALPNADPRRCPGVRGLTGIRRKDAPDGHRGRGASPVNQIRVGKYVQLTCQDSSKLERAKTQREKRARTGTDVTQESVAVVPRLPSERLFVLPGRGAHEQDDRVVLLGNEPQEKLEGHP